MAVVQFLNVCAVLKCASLDGGSFCGLPSGVNSVMFGVDIVIDIVIWHWYLVCKWIYFTGIA